MSIEKLESLEDLMSEILNVTEERNKKDRKTEEKEKEKVGKENEGR